MQTLFIIIVLLYYVSMFVELYWLAVPSLVSSYSSSKKNKQSSTILDILALIAIILPLLNILLHFINWNFFSLKLQNLFLAISILLILVGRIFTFWGTINIRKHLKYNNNSVLKSGIFSISRHPIATGLLISLIGFNLAYLNMFLFLVSLCFVINIHKKVIQEEYLLLGKYGEEYRKYEQQCRRYI